MDYSREHPDPLAARLPPLLVDRQRIVHAAAFRRLQHKTQVFVAPQTDHFRTRLTHTLEVAQQARAIAAVSKLNADLAEIVALAHDLGHPPFGHAGERALDACMKDHGGFEHNRHTLRVVESLEHPYPDFYGLNLTRVVRECLAKHDTQFDKPGDHPLRDGAPPPPESLVVDLADRLTYAMHDLQDALYAGLIAPADLQDIVLWQRVYTGGPDLDSCRRAMRPALDRIVQMVLVAFAAQSTTGASTDLKLDPDFETQFAELERFLLERVYRHPQLHAADASAQQVITALFESYIANPSTLPARFAKRIDGQGTHRVVADYMAGMTDNYCFDEHRRRLGDAY